MLHGRVCLYASGARLETSILLTLPLLFSGIVFSTLLSSKGQVSGMIAMNLLGASAAACWNITRCILVSRFLYLIAMGCYPCLRLGIGFSEEGHRRTPGRFEHYRARKRVLVLYAG